MPEDMRKLETISLASDLVLSIDDEIARKLYSYWMRKTGSRDIPLLRDIDICEIPGLLPYLLLYEVADHEPRFSVRLMGEEVRRVMPNVRPGMSLEVMHGSENWLKVEPLYRDIVDHRRPHYINQPLYSRGQYYRNLRRLLLPLADETGRVRRIIGSCVFVNGRPNLTLPLPELSLRQFNGRAELVHSTSGA